MEVIKYVRCLLLVYFQPTFKNAILLYFLSSVRMALLEFYIYLYCLGIL